MSNDNDRRFIEELLPLKEVSLESAREKSIRHGHLSTLHIWWARRPLIASRAAVLGSLWSKPRDQKEQKDLLELLIKCCKWESTNDSELIRRASNVIIDYRHAKPRVLDSFAGGGAIPLEALRYGCDVYTIDLNPVAVLIELCTLVYPQKYGRPAQGDSGHVDVHGQNREVIRNRLSNDIERWGKWIFHEAEKELSRVYPKDESGRMPVAYFWARTLRCPNPTCGAEVPLIKQLWLANSKKRKTALKLIINKRLKTVSFDVVEGRSIDFDPKKATIRLGAMECPVCKQGVLNKSNIKKVAREKGFGLQPLVIAYHDERKGKVYLPFRKSDMAAFKEASELLSNLKTTRENGICPIPDEVISTDYDWVIKPPMFGLVRWHQVFNSRQALSLATFSRFVQDAFSKILEESGDKEYARAVVTYLAFAVDRSANQNSSACVWVSNGEKIAGTFGRQALPIAWDYVEANPIGDNSWAWKSHISWIREVVEFSSLVNNVANCQQGTATKLPYENSFFDAVIIDPPYYDAVPYSDLSDFFYVWLKRSVGKLYPELFSTPLTPKLEEIVEQSDKVTSVSKRRKDKNFYQTGIEKALIEACRVLKPEGICVIAFAHKTTTAWESLISGLLRSGFSVTASWPIHTERPGRLRAHDSAALASSIWLVCRKRHADAEIGSWKGVQKELESRVKERLDYFLSQGIRGADALLSAIGPALEVFGKYQRVEKVNGNPVSICEFLDKVREVVARHALSIVLSEHELGAVDPATAFYVLWKWIFEQSAVAEEPESKANETKLFVPYSDALKLAQAVGAEMDLLISPYRLLQKEKDDVRLLGPSERKGISGLGQVGRDGTHPFIIDMIHKALILWSSQERGLLSEYMKKSGAQDSTIFWRVTQALSNLLPLQSKEKQLFDGFLGRDVSSAFAMSKRNDYKRMDEFVEK